MSSQLFKKPIPYLAVILAHLIWGANFVVAKLTIQEIPVMSLAFVRFFLAVLLLLPFVFTEKKRFEIKVVDLPKLILVGVLMVVLNIAFFYEGITRTTVIQASVLTLIIPFSSVVIGWWFLKEKVYLVNILGITVGLAGALTVVGVPMMFIGGFNNQNLLGNLLIILASLSWVTGMAISKKLLKKYSTLDLTLVLFLVGTLIFFVPALVEYLQNPTFISRVSLLGLLGLTYITILSSIAAFFLFEWGVGHIGVIASSLFQYIEPVIATLLGVLVLSEQVRFSFLIGAVLIALGAYWGTLGKPEHNRHHKAHRH